LEPLIKLKTGILPKLILLMEIFNINFSLLFETSRALSDSDEYIFHLFSSLKMLRYLVKNWYWPSAIDNTNILL